MSLYDAVTKAHDFAMKMHAGQKYGDKDYSYHLLEVANKVTKLFPSDPDTAAKLLQVAYLHDVLEDTACSYPLLVDMFGVEIANAVELLTKRNKIDYTDAVSLEVYVGPLSKDPLALRIKIADCWSNLEHSMAEKNHKRVYKYTHLLNRLFEHLNYKNLFE